MTTSYYGPYATPTVNFVSETGLHEIENEFHPGMKFS